MATRVSSPTTASMAARNQCSLIPPPPPLVTSAPFSRAPPSASTSGIQDGCKRKPPGAADPTLELVREADDESVPVRHPHLRQRLGAHRIVLADELVERENVGGQRI